MVIIKKKNITKGRAGEIKAPQHLTGTNLFDMYALPFLLMKRIPDSEIEIFRNVYKRAYNQGYEKGFYQGKKTMKQYMIEWFAAIKDRKTA